MARGELRTRLARLRKAEELADEMENLIGELQEVSNRLAQELRYDRPN